MFSEYTWQPYGHFYPATATTTKNADAENQDFVYALISQKTIKCVLMPKIVTLSIQNNHNKSTKWLRSKNGSITL